MEFEGREAGEWNRDVTAVKGGRYTFRDCQTKLKVGAVAKKTFSIEIL